MSAILKNCTCIDEKSLDIIEFWFGGDQQINYRTKWFPEGSSEQQAAIDLEIFTKYGSLLESALRRELMSWQKYRTSCIALIILLDQFSRHIYRHLGEPSPSPKRQETDSLALEVAKFLHSSSSEVILDLPMAEYVFSLMPLRHNQTIDHLQFILSKLTEKEDSSVKANELLQRFRKQTTRRLQHLQDRQRLEATDEILERHPFQADETNILKDRLVSTTEAFLKRTLPSAPYTSSISPSQVTDTNTQKKIIKNIVMISLSGGVDSMVICKILALLRDSKKVAIDNIVAIHIDYANRPESGREAAYVQQWSESLNVHCRVRVVNEVTRGITDRDVYEKVSRNIRYTFYQDCIQAALRGEFDSSEKTIDGAKVEVEYRVSGILFGHHLGDVQENVISNVMRGCSPLDLSGMTETSVTNNVHVWRPLLSHVKDDIYSFAHQYGVPYFKDSTPSWSTRGKLRNQLVPLLIEIYGEGCLRNLSNLAMESDNTQELVYNNLYKPFFDSVRRSQCGLMVNILPYRHQPLCFWKEVLKQLMHSMSMSMIRDKAVGNFVERLQRVTLQQLQKQQKSSSTAAPQLLPAGWLELRKGYHTYLNEANDLIVLRDGTLRKNLVVYNPATTKNQMMQSSGSSQKNKEKKKSSSATEEKKTENPVAVVPKTSSPVGSLKDTIIALSCPDNLLVLTNEVSGIAHILDSSDSVAGISVGVTSLALNNTIQYNVHYDEGRFAALGKEDYEDSNPAEEVECEERGANAVRSNTVPNEDNSIHSKILNFGPWKISITFNRILTTSSTNPLPRKTKLLKNVEDLLSESFSYKIYWPCHSPAGSPVQCDFIFLKDFLNLFEQFIVERRSVGGGAEYYSLAQHFYHEETTLFPDIINALSFDLKSMELRLRDGLPILIPAFVQQTVKDGGAEKFISSYHGVGGSEEEGKKKESSEYFIEFELSYEYINK